MRREPQSGFASAMVRTSSPSLGDGRWSTHRPAVRLPGPESAEALPVPANHGLGANDMERLAPPSPLVGEPQPEETIEALELPSLRAAAKQDELLPQRQVLEREVSAGFERRTQRAQQSDYEGHCPPGSHAAGVSSSLVIGFWQTTPCEGSGLTKVS